MESPHSMQLDEHENMLSRMSVESGGQLPFVVQVDAQCRFKHVARILSLCEEAGIVSPQLVSTDD